MTYSGSFGKAQIGAPRNALDDYLRSPGTAGIHKLAKFEIRTFVGSSVLIYAFKFDDLPLGVRCDGKIGAAAFSVSYHSFDAGAVDLKFLDVAVNISPGNAVLIAGIENAAGIGFDLTSYFLGAEATINQLVSGGQYSDIIQFSPRDKQPNFRASIACQRRWMSQPSFRRFRPRALLPIVKASTHNTASRK